MGYTKHAGLLVLVLSGALPTFAGPSGSSPSQSAQYRSRFPTAQEAQDVITQYLEGLTDRDEDDLLAEGDIVPLFEILEEIGWEFTRESRGEIEVLLLDESDWLVRSLRTKKGTQFMRQMSSFPGGYERLDRMRVNSQGRKEIMGLIDTPGGAKLIEYLTTTKEGRNTGAQITNGGRGANLNTPTKRLYTKAEVAEHFQKSYAVEAARRAEAATSTTP